MRSSETLAQSASEHMRPMEQQISVERVAEIMRQRGNDTDPAVKAHLAWLALPEDERRYWCDRAEAAIADWRSATASIRREAWSNLMEQWLASRAKRQRQSDSRQQLTPGYEVADAASARDALTDEATLGLLIAVCIAPPTAVGTGI